MRLTILLDMAAGAFGERVILGRRTGGLTASDLDRLSRGGAALLRTHKAAALLYLTVNGPAFTVALFAAARAGVPFVPLNYRLSDQQLGRLIARHPGAVAIASAGPAGGLAAGSMPTHAPEEFLTAAAEQANTHPETDLAAEPQTDPAVIIYTSGTTSEPKGVLLHHRNLVSYVFGSVELSSAQADEAAIVSVPPYHIAAVANAISNLYAGRRRIALEQFTGEGWLEMVQTESITHALVVPTMLARILAVPGPKAVPTLRSLAYGGAAMPPRVIEAALRTWPHVDFVNAYGLTETSSTVAVLGPRDHRQALASDDPAIRARLGSAGRPLPHVDVQIRDHEGRPVPAGGVGRILVRGDQVSGQYAGHGSVLDHEGFFDTRDQGYLDQAGYLFVLGRTDDTIIRGGENIAPAEIEAALLSHPKVEDAVVVGLPDQEWGQRVHAAVVVQAGAAASSEELRDHVRRQLRGSKTPDRIVMWDELPRNDLGKIVRRQVVDYMQQNSAPGTVAHAPQPITRP